MDKGKYLDSWKEIAAYLGRNVRTCRNWEHELGLPVHRLEGAAKSHVFAYTGEIDAWREVKGRLPENGDPGNASLPSGPAGRVRRAARNWLIAGLVAGPILAVVTTLLITGRFSPAPEPPLSRSTIKLEPGLWLDGQRSFQELERPTRPALAISHDGRFIVYCAVKENPGPEDASWLYLRRLEGKAAAPIPGTEGGLYPFLSPDDRWIGFWSGDRLKKVPVGGGVATDLCPVTRLFGASWGRAGILFSDQEYGGLSWISAAGGEPVAVTRPDPDREEWGHRLPSWLPDGDGALVTVMKNGFDRAPATALYKRGSGTLETLVEDAADARYVRTGHLVFMRRGTLMAIRFDSSRRKVVGQAVPLVDDIIQMFCLGSSGHTCAGQFAVSDDGTLVYTAGRLVPDMRNSLEWVNMEGRAEPVTDHKAPYASARLSPDGRRIAYSTLGSKNQLFVYDLERGTHTPITDEGVAIYPLWSPDGKQILYSMWGARERLYAQPLDRSTGPKLLATDEDSVSSWAPDGRTLAINRFRPATWIDIALLDIGTGTVRPWLEAPGTQGFPEFSPDGRWIAYASDESGRMEVYVQAFPGPGPKHLISTNGGSQPLWALDGRRLYYRDGKHVWAVDVRTEGDIRARRPLRLFDEIPFGWGFPIRGYDLSPDGRRFLMIREEEFLPAPITEMVLVENWYGEVKRLTAEVKKK